MMVVLLVMVVVELFSDGGFSGGVGSPPASCCWQLPVDAAPGVLLTHKKGIAVLRVLSLKRKTGRNSIQRPPSMFPFLSLLS